MSIKYYFIDTAGRPAFDGEQFDDARPFFKGLATVKFDDCWAALNLQGEPIFKLKCEELGDFLDGCHAPYQSGNRFGLISKEGEVVIPPEYDLVWEVYEGLARVKLNSRYGYVDTGGKVVVKPTYEFASDFSGGFAVVGPPREKFFINRQGNHCFDQFFRAEPFSEGWARVGIDGPDYFIDVKGSTVLKLPPGQQAKAYSEGLAATKFSTKPAGDIICGYIDRDGKIVVEPRFDHCFSFVGGVAHVISNGKHGLIDKFGDWIAEPTYDWVSDCRYERIAVKKGDVYGFLNQKGEQAILPQFLEASDFYSGYAVVVD